MRKDTVVKLGSFCVFTSILFFSAWAVLAENAISHFTFNPVQNPQTVNEPFTVSITARKDDGGLDQTYTGTVDLKCVAGVNLITVEPSVSGAFVQGQWQGSVKVLEVKDAVKLYAEASIAPPVAVDDPDGGSYTTRVDLPLSVSPTNGLLSNDSDPANLPLVAVLVGMPTHGSVVVAADGSFVYSPNLGFSGIDSFTYKAFNAVYSGTPATATISVSGVSQYLTRHFWETVKGTDIADLTNHQDFPDHPTSKDLLTHFKGEENRGEKFGQKIFGYLHPPVTGDYIFHAAGDQAVELWLSSDESPVNAQNIVSAVRQDGRDGNASSSIHLEAGHKYYIEALHKEYILTDYFEIQWESAAAGISRSVIGGAYVSHAAITNVPPKAVNDSYQVNPGNTLEVPKSLGVLVNDAAGWGNPSLTALLVSDVSKGTLSLQFDGTFVYKPNSSAVGTDHFTYQVTDGIDRSNIATVTFDLGFINILPVAVADRYNFAPHATSLVVNTSGVLANDIDPDGLGLVQANLITSVSNGVLSLNNDGTFAYSPHSGFSGIDKFTYTAQDSNGGVSEPATVTIGAFGENGNGSINLDIWYNIDGNKTENLVAGTTNFTTIPDVSTYLTNGLQTPSDFADRYGQRIYGYVHPPASAVYRFSLDVVKNADIFLSTDADPANKVNTFKKKFFLEKGRKYYLEVHHKASTTAHDHVAVLWQQLGTGTDFLEPTVIASEYLSSFGSQSQPVIEDDVYSLFHDEPFSLPAPGVLGGAMDAENDALTVTLASNATHGVLDLRPDGSFTYTPDAGFVGQDRFIFHASDGFSSNSITAITLNVVEENSNAVLSSWNYSGGKSTLTTAAEVTGRYAVAGRNSSLIEIRDIRQKLLHTITEKQIQAAVPWANIQGSQYGISSLAFSTSGRYLFIGICANPNSPGGLQAKDAVLQYNTNTKVLNLFTRLVISQTNTETRNYGMLHYCGELYVGTDHGLLVYTATRNIKHNEAPELSIPVPGNEPVIGMSVDMFDEKIYLGTPQTLYRINVYNQAHADTNGVIRYDPNSSLVPEPIASGNDFQAITMGRSYGGQYTPGLFVLQRTDAASSRIYRIPLKDLRRSGAVSLGGYTKVHDDLMDIAATPCGRMLLATPSTQIVSDATDELMNFDDWVLWYFKQQMEAHKAMIRPDHPGYRRPNISTETGSPTENAFTSSMQTARTVVLADYVYGDPDALPIVEEALDMMLSTHVSNIDGIGSRLQGITSTNYMAGKFSTVSHTERLESLLCIEHYYRNNPVIMKKCRSVLRDHVRMADYCHTTGNVDKPVTAWGPKAAGPNRWWNGENSALLDFAAAQDPLWHDRHMRYVYTTPDLMRSRSLVTWEGYRTEEEKYLDGEECMTDTFVTFYQWHQVFAKFEFLKDFPEWMQQFRNHAAKYSAWTDDNKIPYFTVFNFGQSPAYDEFDPEAYVNPNDLSRGRMSPSTDTLTAEGETRRKHRMDITDLGRIPDLCMYGETWPAVACYLAYREGRMMRLAPLDGWTPPGASEYRHYKGIYALDRWCRLVPDWIPSKTVNKKRFGLVSILPGKEATLSETRYLRDVFMPEHKVSTNSNGRITLDYSAITPRRVLGSNDGNHWTSFGFQYSPFTLPNGISYPQYKVIDPEGQCLMRVMKNTRFDDGFTGWTQSGPGTFTMNNGSEAIVGTSAEITTTASGTQPCVLTQTIDLSMDFARTHYIVRANGALATTNAPGHAQLRIQWDDDADPANGILSEELSAQLNRANPRIEFLLTTQKPDTATHAHLSLVVEPVQPGSDRYIFDDLSIVRLGAEVPLVNSGFENGNLDEWTVTDSNHHNYHSIISGQEAIEGNFSLKFITHKDSRTGPVLISRELDISADPVGTRYIGRVTTTSRHQTATEVSVSGLLLDTANNKEYEEPAVVVEPNRINDQHIFTFRRGLDFDKLTLQISVDRVTPNSSTQDEIVIDSFSLMKENAWPSPAASFPLSE